MVDLKKIRRTGANAVILDPRKIFDRQPKPEGVNDLWKSQDEVLRAWNDRRTDRDVVIKLNTGGGKTLVGLLIAQAMMNEHKSGALYLCATNQLVDQTIAKAGEFQLPAVRYEGGAGKPLPAAFYNGEATLIATYRALFHGYSKFKVKGRGTPANCSVIICDDAHTAFADVRNAFSIVVTKRENEGLYKSVTSLLRPAADAVGRLGTFDHRIGGQDLGAFDIPFWEWKKVAGAIRDLLSKNAQGSEYEYQLPLVLDYFDSAQILVRSTDVMITPMLPPVDMVPTFGDAKHRVFMSATIADDSALIRTFDADADAVRIPIAPASLAGVGERMILAPALTPVGVKNELKVAQALCERVTARKVGVVVLTPSESYAKQRWNKVGEFVVAEGVALAVAALINEQRSDNGPYIFSNRYDGVDLPKDACRLLVMDGLPRGLNAYDEYRANALRGSSQIELSLAQRVEQGLGRGTRGSGDYCVVILLGNVQDWVSRRANAHLMTPASRAQLDLGLEVSKGVTSVDDFEATVNLCLDRDPEWVKLHAQELAARTASDSADQKAASSAVEDAAIERDYFAKFSVGNFKSAKEIAIKAAQAHSDDRFFRGWLLQMAARATLWHDDETWAPVAELQTEAAATNSSLIPPPGQKVLPMLPDLAPQARRVAEQVDGYENPAAYLAAFDRVTLPLTGTVPANDFEVAVLAFGEFLGFSSERIDAGTGEGPDNIWRTEDDTVFVLSCKNEKKQNSPLYKKDLSQLLVDAKWLEEKRPDLKQALVVVMPSTAVSEGLPTEGIYVLTLERLTAMVGAMRVMAGELVRENRTLSEREQLARKLLEKYKLSPEGIQQEYLKTFKADVSRRK
jgi:replicative superfamily II helicase